MTLLFAHTKIMVQNWLQRINGGEDEIRTHDTCYSIPAFQASAFNRSATSPQGLQLNGKIKRPH